MKKDKYFAGVFAIISGLILGIILLVGNIPSIVAMVFGYIMLSAISIYCIIEGLFMLLKNDE